MSNSLVSAALQTPKKKREEYIKEYEDLVKMRQAINQKVMVFDPKCIRNKSNWGAPTNKFMFNLVDSSEKISANQIEDYKTLIEWASPKLVQLLDNIKRLDASDMKTHGKRFKHFIFTDLKSRKYGVDVLASGLKLNGWDLGYTAKRMTVKAKKDANDKITMEVVKYGKIEFKTAETLQQNKYKNFYILTSRTIFDQPITVANKREILARFNERPDNIYGENVRIIIMDSGFKEGIDLFDIKYIHVFEPQETMADMKQVIGRGTRTCGQKGLPFDPKEGWPLHVYLYDMVIDKQLEPLLDNATTAYGLYMKAQKRDIRLYNFIGQIEDVVSKNAVDYVLTEPVHTTDVVYHKQRLTDAAERALAFKSYDPPTKPMDAGELRAYVKREYGDFTWETPKMENGCIEVPKKDYEAVKLLNFTMTQGFISNYFTPTTFTKGMLLWHSVGTGKCHARDTPIIMYDGRIKMVQDIVVGDVLMGDDSTPRRVMSLATGQDEMYDIVPTACISSRDIYTVNSEHILVLRNVVTRALIEIEVTQYMALSDTQKEELVGISAGHVDFFTSVGADVSLADVQLFAINFHLGNSIPECYKCGPSNIRRELLDTIIENWATWHPEFFIDTDSHDCGVALDPVLGITVDDFKDIIFVARSLGYVVQVTTASVIINSFYKDDPTADVIETGPIAVVPKGRGDYYGFTLDGNNRYLLGDFTITHNTCTAIATASKTFEAAGYTILWVTRTTLRSDVWKNIFGQSCHEKIRTYLSAAGVMPQTLPEQRRLLSKSWMQPISYKQFTNLIERKNSIYQTLAKINGHVDPLRKTLLIIDEAHKLYGVSDLSTIERPNMAKLHEALMASYAVSGADSARLLVMTATPITNNPMELVQLINLLRPLGEQLPFEFANFSEKYLDKDGEFTENGKHQFCNAIAGYVSYLNLERDIRKFAQPQIIHVETPLVNPMHVKEFDKRHALELIKHQGISIDNRIAELNMLKALAPSTKAADIAKIRDAFNCSDKKGEEKKLCKRIVKDNIGELKENLKMQSAAIIEEIRILKDRKRALPQSKKDIRRDFDERGDNILESKYFANPFFAFKTNCKEQGQNDKILDDYITNVPAIKQLDNEVVAEQANIKQTQTEIKTLRKIMLLLKRNGLKEGRPIGTIRASAEWKKNAATLKNRLDRVAEIRKTERSLKKRSKQVVTNETRKLKKDLAANERKVKENVKLQLDLKRKENIVQVPVEKVIHSPAEAKKIITERAHLIDDIKGEIKSLSKTRKAHVTTVVKDLKFKNEENLKQLQVELKNVKMGAQEIVDDFIERIHHEIANRPVQCAEGKIYNPDTGRCVKVKVPKVCPEGKVLNPDTGRCVKVKPVAVPKSSRRSRSSSRRSSRRSRSSSHSSK